MSPPTNDALAAPDPIDSALDALDAEEADALADEALDTELDDDDDGGDEGGKASSEDDGDESDDDDEDKPEGGDKPKKRRGKSAKARIGELTRKIGDYERENHSLKEDLKAANDRIGAFERFRQEADRRGRDTHDQQPTESQYEEGKRQGYSRDEVEQLVSEGVKQQRQNEIFGEKRDSLKKTLIDGGAEDALKRLSNARLVEFQPEALLTLAECKHPAIVAKALAGKDELFKQLSSTSDPVAQSRLIERVSARIDTRRELAKEQRGGQPATKATRGVRGSARTPEKHPDDMDPAEYDAWRRKQGW